MDPVEEPQSEGQLRRRARLVFAVAVFLTGLLGFFSWHTVQQAAEDADWVAHTPWVANLAADPAIRSNTSVCLKVIDPAVLALKPEAQAAFAKDLAAAVEKEGAGYDIAFYRDAPPGLRIWCGATVEAADVDVLTQWLDWAFAKVRGALPKAA